MDQTHTQTWNFVLETLEKEVSRANFLTLFKNTALLSLEDNIATVAAPSAMIINLIQKRYMALIKEALEKKLQQPNIDVIFVPKTILRPKTGEKDKGKDDQPLFAESLGEVKPFIGHLPRVRPDFTFETLAVSSSNQLAFTSASTVAKNIGRSYNPLFIYGPVGVGKTHLMQAIANDVYQKDPARKIIYTTSEEFTNEVVEAIRTNQTHVMKKRFRSAFLLMIDDVQFIAGKDRVQEELFHTFNNLIDQGSQIVLSSDRPPSEIQKLEKRLSSRFSGGLTVDIEPPDFELKTAILLIKAKKYNVVLPIEAAKTIAQAVEDARSLEGALLRIITKATTTEEEITQDFVKKALRQHDKENPPHMHVEDIIKEVCNYYNLKPTQIKGPKRDATLVKARQIAMYLLKKELDLPFAEIGNVLGGRDHTTIMYGVEKMEKTMKEKPQLSEEILGITKSIHG